MAEVGTYYITIMPEMSKFTGGVKSALGDLGSDSGKAFNSSFVDIVKGSAIGTMLGGIASSLGNTFMSGISTGISRLDTLNNFPRVMQSFGYSADEASDAVNLIMERLRGLPTASQDVVALTQAISDSTGSLDTASRAALGFNDMLLAGGASTQEVATATGVLNRVLGKQSATAAQWQSIVSVMPKQMDMVAESMLGAGASSMDLYAALEDGTVSYNDMLNAIIKLDEEGSGAIASFYDQAKANSIGIGSAIANIQNRVGAGWANVLNAIGQQEIHDVLERTADAFKAPLDALASGIAYLKEQISNTSIMENAAKVLGLIGDAISGIWNDGGPTILKSLADSFVSLIDGALQWLADHGDFVTTAVWGLAGALAALAGWQLGAGLAALPGVLAALGTALAANPFGIIVSGIAIVVAALYGFFTQTETGRQLWQGFCDALSTLWDGLQNDWATLMGVLQREWESFKAWISGIPDWFGGIIAGILAKGAEFRAWWDKSWKEASDSCTRVWNNISTSVSTLWGNIVGGVLAKGGELAQWWNTHWNNVKTTASNAWNSIKSDISSVLSGIVSNISERFNSALSTVRSVFDSIKQSISDKINAAKNAVSDAISAIKGLFNFSWSLPRPTLPHINWHMEDVMGLLSIPVFDGISWYGKGGVFSAATLIGIGEKGKEAALPLNKQTYGEIARGIQGEMGIGGSGVIIDKLADTIVVREEADIDRIADALDRKIRRERMAMA